jgi:hypothetical protein
MTPSELYDALDRAGAIYEIVEIFEGVRVISVQVDDEVNDEVDDEQNDMVSDSSLTTGEKS